MCVDMNAALLNFLSGVLHTVLATLTCFNVVINVFFLLKIYMCEI